MSNLQKSNSESYLAVKSIDNALQNQKEWGNVPEGVRSSFKTMLDVIVNQNQTIKDLQKSISQRPTKQEIQAVLLQKLDTTDFTLAINKLNTQLSTLPTREELQSTLEEKVSKPELAYLLNTKLSIDDGKNLLSTKANVIEVNEILSNIDQKIEMLSKDTNKKLCQFASMKDIIKINQQLSTKITLNDIAEVVSSKANKDEVNAQLRLKANKVDVDAQLKAKIDITELNELISILEGKASREDVEGCLNILNTKLDKTYINNIQEGLMGKLDLGIFESLVKDLEEYKGVTQKKIDDIDQDLDNLIENIKLQFKNINFVVSNLDKNKLDIEKINVIVQNLSKKLDADTYDAGISKVRADFSSNINEFKKEFANVKDNLEKVLNSKVEASLVENNKQCEGLNKTINLQNENIFALKRSIEENLKKINDVNSQITFICSENLGKFNNIYSIIKEKLDRKEYANTKIDMENNFKIMFTSTLENKATYKDLELLYESFQKELKQKFIEWQRSNTQQISDLSLKCQELNDTKIGGDNFEKLIGNKFTSLNNLIELRATTSDLERLKTTVVKLQEEILNRPDKTKTETTNREIKKNIDELNHKLNAKTDLNDLEKILSTKADSKALNSLTTNFYSLLDKKVNLENFTKFLQNQKDINNIVVSSALGKWEWRSGKLKGSLIPWEEQSINSLPTNFLWEQGKTSIMISSAGLYCIIIGIFGGNERTEVKLTLNGECIRKQKVNMPLTETTINQKICNVASITIESYVIIPERARISLELEEPVQYSQGFILVKTI